MVFIIKFVIILFLNLSTNMTKYVKTFNNAFNGNSDYNVELINNEKCENKSSIRVYFSNNNQTIFLSSCVSEVYLINEMYHISLGELLRLNNYDISKSISFLTNKIQPISYFYDGGTVLYKGDDLNDIVILKCNTINGNSDIYIGNQSTSFSPNLCN